MTKKAAQSWFRNEIVIDYDREEVSCRQFQRDVRERLQMVRVSLNGYAPGYHLYVSNNGGDSSVHILTKDQAVVSAVRYYDYGADLMGDGMVGLSEGTCLYEKDGECGDILNHADRNLFDLMFLLGRFEDCDTFADASVLWTNRLNREGCKRLV